LAAAEPPPPAPAAAALDADHAALLERMRRLYALQGLPQAF